MSKKGCSPDNSACEGFFGRLRNEFFYYRDWDGVTVDSFMELLNEYIVFYNERRKKQSLGWMSHRQYRSSKGWSGKDKLDFLLRIFKRIVARIPLETCSPRWNACAPYCNRALCT